MVRRAYEAYQLIGFILRNECIHASEITFWVVGKWKFPVVARLERVDAHLVFRLPFVPAATMHETMQENDQIAHLKRQIDALSAQNASVREGGFRGSKAESLLALEYDRIPNIAKTPRAIAFQRKVATAVMILVPVVLIAIAVIGGINAYQDNQQSAQAQRAAAKWGDDLRHDVEQSLKHSN